MLLKVSSVLLRLHRVTLRFPSAQQWSSIFSGLIVLMIFSGSLTLIQTILELITMDLENNHEEFSKYDIGEYIKEHSSGCVSMGSMGSAEPMEI